MRIARRPLYSSAVAVVLAAALLATVTACSSGDGGSKPLKALRHLPADANASKQVTYVDNVRIRKLSAADPKRFATIAQLTSPLLSGYRGGPWGQTLKESQIDTAVDTAAAGHWDGSFDAAAVTASLKKSGYTSTERDGGQVWKPAGSGPAFAVSDDEIRYATDAARFSAADPGDSASLAGKEEYRLVAGCLGDVYRADFNALSTTEPVRLSALGQQADDSGKNTETLCAAVKDQATADRLAAKLRSVVKDRSPRFDGTTVTVTKGDHPVVSATVPDTAAQRPGRLLLTDFQLWTAVGEL
ncbi:hypothetical protein [Actinacidiphila paucisporea]|uniref:Lipoprotein n=1 Tax=Actinacidiphila paucisporea TaxID=310782 RepID=A0A1M7NX36_9ACTN|nr:hypothetical protein [Actinacidiphila paucisporea]SHN08655.1 hypothetical protein SAMN05216499_12037 [Actinacidiphila paucisporea]